MQIIIPQYTGREKIDKTGVGGKAFNLWQMQQQGFAVPAFFILPAETINGLIAPVRNEIEEVCAYAGNKNDAQLHYLCNEIEKKIIALKMPVTFLQAIFDTCTNVFGEGFLAAVRSSAIAEDGANISFAGQHASILYVDKDKLSTAILKVISSAWCFAALKYRLIHGLQLKNIQFAVVIQRMVDAQVSGIGFSMNFKGNMADMVLAAGYGCGEGIVTDKAEADTYTVNRQLSTIEKDILTKLSSLVYIPQKGLAITPVDETLRNSPALNDEQIFEVCEYMDKAEKMLHTPADIEFSYSKTGKLYILQARPITTLQRDRIKILDNTNIVESYPGITLPLTYSFVLKAYEKVFTGSAGAFMVSTAGIQQNLPAFQNLLFHIYGKIYYRLDNWYRMLALVHNSKKSLEAWEKAVGLPGSESDKVNFSFRGKARTIVSSAKLITNYRRGNKKFFKQFQTNYAFLKNYSQHLSSPAALWQHYEEATALLFRPWYQTIVNDFIAFKCFGWLQNLIKKNKMGEDGELANDLLCGIGQVESEDAILMVLDLKEEIKSDAVLAALFTQPADDILAALNRADYKSFQQRLYTYLDKYGDRTLAELKLETPSLRSRPAIFIAMLKNQLLSAATTAGFREKQSGIRQSAEAEVNAKLKWFNPQKLVFNTVLQLARYGLRNRENMRFCRTRAYSAVKDIFLEIANMMVEKNIIQKQEDVFYLDTAALRSFCMDNNMENRQLQIAGIKEKYIYYSSLSLPGRIMYIDDDLPVFDKTKNSTGTKANCYKGVAVSKGVVSAEAMVITEPGLDIDVHGKILISKMTDPGWAFLMSQAAGLVCEKGSLLSHTAIVGRELGIPVVVGITGATSIFKTGDMLRLDGGAGTVEFISITNI